MLLTIRLVFELGLAAIAAYFVFNVYAGYRAATGSWWTRLLAGARNSATMLWAKFCVVLAAVVANLDHIADALGQPDAKEYIQVILGNPKAVAGVMLALTAVTMWARARTLVS